MRTTIDAAGRIVVPKALREQLGLKAGLELEVDAVDGRLEVAVLSRVTVERGPHGLRFAAHVAEPLNAEEVRGIVERGRR